MRNLNDTLGNGITGATNIEDGAFAGLIVGLEHATTLFDVHVKSLDDVVTQASALHELRPGLETAHTMVDREAAAKTLISANDKFNLGIAVAGLENATDGFATTAGLESVKDKINATGEWIKEKIKAVIEMFKKWFNKLRVILGGYEKSFEKLIEDYKKLTDVKDDAKFSKSFMENLAEKSGLLQLTLGKDGKDIKVDDLIKLPLSVDGKTGAVTVVADKKALLVADKFDGADTSNDYYALSFVTEAVHTIEESIDDKNFVSYAHETLAVKSNVMKSFVKDAKETDVKMAFAEEGIRFMEVLKGAANKIDEIEKEADNTIKDIESGNKTLDEDLEKALKTLKEAKEKDPKDQKEIDAAQEKVDDINNQIKTIRRALSVTSKMATRRSSGLIGVLSAFKTIYTDGKGKFKS